MKWLPKEKRNPFILVVVITAAVLMFICFGLLRSQGATRSKVAENGKAAALQLQNIEKTIKEGDLTANELAAATVALTRAEEDVASGDLYSWAYNTFRVFKQPYKVEIIEIGHPAESEMDLIPSFPYKQIRFTVNGTGYFHDIGKFISDLENNFPHCRVANLAMEPVDSSGEKLSFKMEVIALTKPNAS